VTTSTLMSVGRSEPRKIIGTVNTAEFLVAVAASAGFIIGLDRVHESWQPVLGLLIGGLIGAPIAAWIVTVIKPDILGGIVGAVLVGLNGARVSVSLGWFGGVLTSVVVVVCLVAVIRGLRGFRGRRGRRAAAYPAGNDDPQGEASDSSDTVVITVDTPR
ncbi:TSUP family transporter, partial [Corynebacterium glyciniphilum]|uniref:TSUP family transporter n=1 Tax=Corynebacterium glyciniphilum TaxID=1404244 RepID=UPI00264E3667